MELCNNNFQEGPYMKKRILSLLLVITCLLAVCPLQVSALSKVHVHTYDEPTSGVLTDSTPVTVNPLYADIWEPEPFPESVADSSDYDLAPAYSEYLSWDEGVQAMRDHMKLRETTFTIYYTTETYVTNAESTEDNPSTTNVMFDQALLHTGVPTEGDYLYRHYRQWSSSASRSHSNGLYYVALTMNMSYSDTAEQQPIMDAAVNDLLADLNVYNASDYEKVCAVYDYICANVEYDYARLEDDSYVLKYTAYAALIDGIAVCQGYSNLFYRLMLELGVDTRVIRGYSFGGNHAWNIVQLDGLYYNVDSTWDAGATNYDYFLRCQSTFADHERRTEYETAEFHSEYPMGSADYNPANPEQPPAPEGAESGTYGEGLTWILYENGDLHISGIGELPDCDEPSYSFTSAISDRIKRVVIEEGITSIGVNTFCGCTNLTQVEFPSTLTRIGKFAFSGCALTEVVLPDGLTTLDSYAFEYCTSLTSAYIPASVTAISDAPFSGCSALTDLRVDSGNPNYCTDSYGVIYNKEMTRLIQMPGGFAGAYTIPGTVTVLGWWSFEDCHGLTSVEIPSSVTELGEGTFSGCTGLTEITVPSGITFLPAHIFYCCFALQSVTLPASVTSIERGAFRDCPDLTDVYYGGTQEQWNNVFVDEENNSALDFATIHYAEAEHTHTYTTEVTDPTCTEDGFTTYTCECGDSYVSDTVEALGHDWSEWTVTVEPTASSQGTKSRECANCGETETAPFSQNELLEPIESTHPYTTNMNQEWTHTIPGAQQLLVTFSPEFCLEDGFDLLYIYDGTGNCINSYTGTRLAGETVTVPGDTVKLRLYTDQSVCEWGFRVTSIVPVYEGVHEHSYTAVVTAPTCTEQGYTTYTCSCGESYQGSYTDPVDHNWSAWEVSVPSSEEVPGEESRECTNCGKTESREIPVLEHTHNYTSVVVTAPTCIAQGYTTHTCSCGDSYVDTYTDPVDHEWGNWYPILMPTETTPGKENHQCMNCELIETREIPALGHTHSYTPVVTAPTCTQQGYTTYTCSCGDTYTANYVNAAGHKWGAWETLKEATQTQAGEEKRECSVCRKIEARVIPMIPSVTFTDVPEGAWFSAAVNWAVSNNVTSGTGNGTFSPDMACSRSQVVTFLWRAAGSPEPSGTNPFSDVTEGAWYYKAVLWAVENGITSGTTATTFAPDMACSRSQVVTFLYRAAGAPEVSGSNPFTDVSKGAWYYNAVLWAVENSITSGTTATTFAPDMTCSRSQVVTFLYRAEG